MMPYLVYIATYLWRDQQEDSDQTYTPSILASWSKILSGTCKWPLSVGIHDVHRPSVVLIRLQAPVSGDSPWPWACKRKECLTQSMKQPQNFPP